MQHRTRRHNGPMAPLTGPEDDQVITRLDYFAARAPREIPGWFMPDRPEYDGPAMPAISDSLPEDDRKMLESWLRDPCFDLEGEFAPFQAATEAYRKARKEYAEFCEWDRYFQWPWAWAESMLVMREAYTEEQPE